MKRLIVLFLLAFPSGAAFAAWPSTSNQFLPVGSGTGEQVYPSIVSDGSGGAFIAWHDNRSGGYDVYIQRVSATGAALWTPNGVPICTATGDQANTQLALDGAGGVIVTWHDFRAGNWDIYAQRFDANGAPQWTANGVSVCTFANLQNNPQIVSDGAGGAILAWYDQRTGNGDIYAQRLNAAGVAQWIPNGSQVCGAASEQNAVRLVSDGVGGAILTWHDLRSNVTYDIYAQRMLGGTGQWAVNGVAISTAAANQLNPTIAPDGAGGAIIAWDDLRLAQNNSDIYAQRVNQAGVVQWTANGSVMANAAGNQYVPKMVADLSGGAIIVFSDQRNDFWIETWAQRVNYNGGRMWSTSGVQVCVGSWDQQTPQIVPDGAGGAVITWQDFRDGTQRDIYGQRVTSAGALTWGSTGIGAAIGPTDQWWPVLAADASGNAIFAWNDPRSGNNDVNASRVDARGYPGNPEPVIARVRDVPNDQGGKVRVTWNASYLDAAPAYTITEYRLWRSAPDAATLGNAARFARDADEAASTGALWQVDGYAWEYVATQVAAQFGEYSLVASTTGDSIPGSNPYTAFLVEARAGSAISANRWSSLPDSGYSVDDLAPGAPSALTSAYASGATSLHWARNPEADLAGYRLYKGANANFVPGPANLVASPPDTGYSDPGPPAYYKLSAVDAHGNESAYAATSPGTVDVPGIELPAVVALAHPRPNPATASTRIEFDLPRAGAISLTVYGPTGRAVRTLANGVQEAGRKGVSWDLRDDAGRDVPSGIYFIRLETADARRMQRMIVMK